MLDLLLRFSLPPNQLGLCGDKSLTAKLMACLNDPTKQLTDTDLASFKTQLPYLLTIADKHHLKPTDPQVIEAYWLGNDLLTAFTLADYPNYINNLKKVGVAPMQIKLAESRPPKQFIPFHLTSVLSNIDPALYPQPQIQNMITNCMIRSGKIISTSPSPSSPSSLSSLSSLPSLPSLHSPSLKVTIKTTQVSFTANSKHLQLTPTTITINQPPRFMSCEPRRLLNRTVAIHWNTIITPITTFQKNNLNKWTKQLTIDL